MSVFLPDKVQRFRARFGEDRFVLACHAAFPAAITTDMLYQMWANFYAYYDDKLFEVQVERLAVADVLLSALMRPTGEGDVFEMEAESRGAMLDWLRNDPRFGERRLHDLALFTRQYAEQCLSGVGKDSLRETLIWGALATLQPAVALAALRDRIGQSLLLGQQSEVMRMRDLAEAFAYQERRPDERDASSFGEVLQYTVALKAGAHNLASHVKSRLVSSNFELSKEKPEHGLAFPFPVEMIDDALFEQLPNNDKPLEQRQIMNIMISPEEGIALNSMGFALQKYVNQWHVVQLRAQVFANQNATQSAVIAYIRGIAQTAKPGDVGLFVFAGQSGMYRKNTIYDDPFSNSYSGQQTQQQQSYSQNTAPAYEEGPSVDMKEGEVFLRMADTSSKGENGLTYRQLVQEAFAYHASVNFILIGMPPNFLGDELLLPNIVMIQSHEGEYYQSNNIEGKAAYPHTHALTKILNEAEHALTFEQIINGIIEVTNATGGGGTPSLVSLRKHDKNIFALKQLATDAAAIYYARAILALETNALQDAKRYFQHARFVIDKRIATQTELQLVRQLYAKAGEKAAAIYARAIAFSNAGPQTKLHAINSLTTKIDVLLVRPDALTFELSYDANALAVLSIIPPPLGMINISGGTFLMGDVFGEGNENESPIFEVNVEDFEMGRYAVTFEEYDIYCEATGKDKPQDMGWGRGRRPVVNITWYDAASYCHWRSEMEGLDSPYFKFSNSRVVDTDFTLDGYRLPTEAEWEYAAREQGKKLRFGNGKDVADPNEMNFNANEPNKKTYSVSGLFRNQTAEVGEFPPNALGLHDMSGNIFEWCFNEFGKYEAGTKIKLTDKEATFRGGSWFSNPEFCRATFRGTNQPRTKEAFIGFRLVKRMTK